MRPCGVHVEERRLRASHPGLSKQNRSLSKLFELLSKQNLILSKLFGLLSKNKLFLSKKSTTRYVEEPGEWSTVYFN
ncbi:hypothetical protein [Lysinibacillus sp. G4S2]|uniref:hypothetical protein n=1 Tax=Lysinibacillus sp. G4S2 TaxID=3055859 RepID=UPI0025A1199F|nr:hypothetical protein [Lysinibacillus sp. G4S2]MDM5250047.1 hypothetical protein [Lysinibacillus sp. G4S2]